MNHELLKQLRKEYSIGTRVELVQMDDCQAPPIGTKGTVSGVDDIGSILVDWDNGSSLNVVYGADVCIVLDSVTTICYNQERKWDKREDAIASFFECLLNSEGTERERYLSILLQLMTWEGFLIKPKKKLKRL